MLRKSNIEPGYGTAFFDAMGYSCRDKHHIPNADKLLCTTLMDTVDCIAAGYHRARPFLHYP